MATIVNGGSKRRHTSSGSRGTFFLRLSMKRLCVVVVLLSAVLLVFTAVAHRRVVVVVASEAAARTTDAAASASGTIDGQKGGGGEDGNLLPGANGEAVRPQTPDGGAFVHMGKTGGSTLSVLLRNGCHSYMPHPCRNVTAPGRPEFIASELIKSYYHVPDFGLLPQSRHDFFVVTTRDPFDRVVSSFVYEHYRNRFAAAHRGDKSKRMSPVERIKYKAAYRCFPTLNHWVSFLPSTQELAAVQYDVSKTFSYPYQRFDVVPTDISCRDVARAALYGNIRLFTHLYFSYNKIRSLLPPPSSGKGKIYVTRQEHLWDDWIAINQILEKEHGNKAQRTHDDGTLPPPPPGFENIRNTTQLEEQYKLPVTRKFSSGQISINKLCGALEKEYRAYLWFLSRAENLKTSEAVKEVIDNLRYKKKCTDLATSLQEWIEKEQPGVAEVN